MKRRLAALALCISLAQAGVPEPAQCMAPAKPGGGFDISCQLAQSMLQNAGLLKQPMQTTYLPGGIGAVAFNAIVTRRPAEGHTIVAFSGGSLLNLAQGRFGPFTERDVRWVAAIGIDHGVIAVRRDSPYTTLAQLVATWKANPNAVVFGSGGTIGSQDWMKAALLARAAGINHKTMRFVAFEGGGDALSALVGRHVHAMTGDAAEVARQIDQGSPIRVLAVLAEQRLPGRWASVATAREQGFDVRWPIVRGFYLGPKVSDLEYREWVQAFAAAMARPGYVGELERAGLQPGALTGGELQGFIDRSMVQYRALAAEFGLGRR
jgi:putative tricarboxylic transport membrane protein